MSNLALDMSCQWEAMLKALSERGRLLIVYELIREEASVNDLADRLDMHLYNISKHLKVLEASGLIEKRKHGPRIIYKAADRFNVDDPEEGRVFDPGYCRFKFH